MFSNFQSLSGNVFRTELQQGWLRLQADAGAHFREDRDQAVQQDHQLWRQQPRSNLPLPILLLFAGCATKIHMRPFKSGIFRSEHFVIFFSPVSSLLVFLTMSLNISVIFCQQENIFSLFPLFSHFFSAWIQNRIRFARISSPELTVRWARQPEGSLRQLYRSQPRQGRRT